MSTSDKSSAKKSSSSASTSASITTSISTSTLTSTLITNDNKKQPIKLQPYPLSSKSSFTKPSDSEISDISCISSLQLRRKDRKPGVVVIHHTGFIDSSPKSSSSDNNENQNDGKQNDNCLVEANSKRHPQELHSHNKNICSSSFRGNFYQVNPALNSDDTTVANLQTFSLTPREPSTSSSASASSTPSILSSSTSSISSSPSEASFDLEQAIKDRQTAEQFANNNDNNNVRPDQFLLSTKNDNHSKHRPPTPRNSSTFWDVSRN